MKTENLIMLALLGVGVWYLMRGQTATAATAPAIKLPFDPGRTIEESNILYARIAEMRKREQAGLPTAQKGTW